MKKEPKIEYGIEIVKPWSQAMYDHNDQVADQVREDLSIMWSEALEQAKSEMEEDGVEDFLSQPWVDIYVDDAYEDLVKIQIAVTCYAFGFGYSIEAVDERIEVELNSAPYFRLKDMAEELGMELEKGFVGF